MKLELGVIAGTPAALQAIADSGGESRHLVARHQNGDWGDIGSEDWAANTVAAHKNERVLSAYLLPSGLKVWIVTEWDRSATTILLPSEY